MVQRPRNPKLPLALETIGDHIRKERIERGLLQADVARIIGVIEQCITNWENHRGQPQIHLYPAVIAFLGYYPLNHNLNTIQGKLMILRHCLGVSYKGLGTIWGVDGSTVRGWELGKYRLSAAAALKIDLLMLELPEFVNRQYCS